MSYQLQHSNYFRLMLLAYIALLLLCIFHFDIANGLKLSLLAVLTAALVYELRQQQKPLNKLMLGQQSFAIGGRRQLGVFCLLVIASVNMNAYHLYVIASHYKNKT